MGLRPLQEILDSPLGQTSRRFPHEKFLSYNGSLPIGAFTAHWNDFTFSYYDVIINHTIFVSPKLRDYTLNILIFKMHSKNCHCFGRPPAL